MVCEGDGDDAEEDVTVWEGVGTFGSAYGLHDVFCWSSSQHDGFDAGLLFHELDEGSASRCAVAVCEEHDVFGFEMCGCDVTPVQVSCDVDSVGVLGSEYIAKIPSDDWCVFVWSRAEGVRHRLFGPGLEVGIVFVDVCSIVEYGGLPVFNGLVVLHARQQVVSGSLNDWARTSRLRLPTRPER